MANLTLTPAQHSKINKMSRQTIARILESYSVTVYDNEDTELLREALRVNTEDGTIALASLDS